MPFARITGTGFYVPPKIVKNDDLKAFYDTSDEWIYERSGIKERRFIEGELGPADLAVPAVQLALKEANTDFESIDFLIFATLSPECWFPGSGCFLQEKLNPDSNIPCLDIRMQCSGFIYGLSLAELYIKSGKYKKILVVGAEVQSTSIDKTEEGRTVGVLFGDGAGAVVVEAVEEPVGILSTHLHTQGKYAKELWVPEPSSMRSPKVNPDGKGLFPYMNGREVFKHAVTRMIEVINETLNYNGWKKEDIDLFILHQANSRIVETISKQLGISMDKFFVNIHKYGNTTAATIPICMHEAQLEGKLKRNDKVISATFGSGFTWAGAAIIW